jgi:antitoxin HicB
VDRITSEVLSELLARPYRKTITKTPEGTVLGEVPELPGCMTEGDSEAEALALLNDAMSEWFKTAIELGRAIPEPIENERAYSGKFNLRVPKMLHRQLTTRARENEVSLNEYCVLLLSEGVNQGSVSKSGPREKAIDVQPWDMMLEYLRLIWRYANRASIVSLNLAQPPLMKQIDTSYLIYATTGWGGLFSQGSSGLGLTGSVSTEAAAKIEVHR